MTANKASKAVKSDKKAPKKATASTGKRKATAPAAPSAEKATKKAKTSSATESSRPPKAAPLAPPPVSDDKSEPSGSNAHVSDNDSDDDEPLLHGFSSDDEDSSDEEDLSKTTPLEVSKLPTVAKDDEVVKRKLEKAKRKPTEHRGVVYVGRLPHGFFEDQLKAYFSQFGDVSRLRVSRNKKTGKSKHYAFIEFTSSDVAQIVSETMDNYLLAGHLLKCKVIPKEEVHPELWVGANRKYRPQPQDQIVRDSHNKSRSDDDQAKAKKRLKRRQKAQLEKLKESGIKYDYEPVTYTQNTVTA